MSRIRLALLALVVALAITGTPSVRAADGPYGPVAAENGTCPENYAYAGRDDVCVSQIGEYDGRLWRCGKRHHPQFQVFLWEKRPQRCCRQNWPSAGERGKGKGLCHRFKPKPYDTPGGQG